MKLSIIIPCFNEESSIDSVIGSVREVDIPGISKEIIVVDDGSQDNTAAILASYKDGGDITIHFSKENRGKGSAIRTGLEHVTGDIIIIQDADLEYNPKQYPLMIAPIATGMADVVYGSRFAGQIRGMRLANRIGNHILTWLANVLYHAHITDEATCYKAFRASVLREITLKCIHFEFCPEVTAKLCKKRYHIAEVPIEYTGRTLSEGKKVRWTDGLEAIWTLIKYRFVD